MRTTGPVIVGLAADADASMSGAAAIDLAAAQADRRELDLQLVYGSRALPAWASLDAGTDDGQQILAKATARVRSRYPRLTFDTRVGGGGVAAALVDASPEASLVVVPADTRVHYGGLLAGLVSIQVAAHAQAPVTVVPEPASGVEPECRLVVGFDGSEASTDALAFAFDQARTRAATVHVVHVWDLPTHHGFRPLTARAAELPALQSAAEEMLAAATARWTGTHPQVTVVRDAVHSGNPVRVLNDAGTGAEMIVVGRRGHGGFASLALGSVSDGLVRYARTPVVVVCSNYRTP